MSDRFTTYSQRQETQQDFIHFVIGRLFTEYSEIGEQMPRFSIENGKLQTDSQELRLRYRYILQGASLFAGFLDAVDTRRNQQQDAKQKQGN